MLCVCFGLFPKLGLGQVTCMWEGFPQAATISRSVEVRWLRHLTQMPRLVASFEHQLRDRGSNFSPEERKLLRLFAALKTSDRELVLTDEFDTLELDALHSRVQVQFVLNGTKKLPLQGKNPQQRAQPEFSCRLRMVDGHAERPSLQWLEKVRMSVQLLLQHTLCTHLLQWALGPFLVLMYHVGRH